MIADGWAGSSEWGFDRIGGHRVRIGSHSGGVSGCSSVVWPGDGSSCEDWLARWQVSWPDCMIWWYRSVIV